MAEVRLEGISKRYGDFFAVRDFTLTVPDGEFLVLLGPSGCGKTTTLRMIAGFVEPSTGSIHLGSTDITSLPPWRRNAGLVFQNYALFPHLTVTQNVAFGLEMRKVPKDEIPPRVNEALRLVRLSHLGDRLPRQLSGGQQQRVALARALVFRPDVLLLDEPLSNLDAKLRQEVRIEIRELQRKLGLTAIMVTHDQEEALTMADRLVVMSEGEVKQAGSQRELYEQPADRFVAGFVGRSTFLEGAINGEAFRSTGGLHVTSTNPSGIQGPATLAIRPERVSVTSNMTAPDANHFPGEVEFVSYLGGLLDIHVRVNDSERIIAQVPNRDGVFAPTVGEKVVVGWPPGAVSVFAGIDAAEA